jgi:hopanoid biosynthesis associated protein HpnK
MTSDVVLSADDFGLTESVNEAVERAHRDGVLTQASLMVAGEALGDAVRRARAMPGLKVGLHLTLVDGASMLGHARLPDITGPDGRFPRDQVRLAVRYFFSPRARAQLRAEIAAQFDAFAATGLALHHADAHKHMHMHPTVAGMMLAQCRTRGVTRVRVPAEPPVVLRACGERPGIGAWAMYGWSFLLRARTGRRAASDQVFGIAWSGHMTETRVRRLLGVLPPGRTEIYFHPAARRDETLAALMPDYEHIAELQTLLDLRPTITTGSGGLS